MMIRETNMFLKLPQVNWVARHCSRNIQVMVFLCPMQELLTCWVVLYFNLAAVAMASFISSKDTPLMEHVRLNDGFDENKKT